MDLKIVTPERVVFEDSDVDAVYALTPQGEVGILPNHQPMVAPLSISVLRYEKAGQKNAVAVMGGILNTSGQRVSVLADAAEMGSEVDKVRAEHAQERAEARLKAKTPDLDVERSEAALRRSLMRQKAAQFHSS